MMQILIVKMSSLGDIIHAFPVLQYIKQYYPQAQIDWVVEQPFAELVRAHPFVNRVLCVQTKKWRSQLLKGATWQELAHFRRELRQSSYHIVLDLQGNVKSGFVTACAKSLVKVGFDYATVPEWPNVLATNRRCNPPKGRNIREDYLFIAQSAFGKFAPITEKGMQLKLTLEEKTLLNPVLEQCQQIKGLKVLVCPGSNWPNKQLSKETLKNFLQCLSKQLSPHFLLLWGNPAEKVIADELATVLPQQSLVINKLPLPALQNLMTHVDLVLAMDSLPLHLAGTTSTPTYSVFGASSAKKYKPLGEQHQAFQGRCPYGKHFEKRCDQLRTCKTGACIKQLEGQQLFDHFYEWWKKRRQEMGVGSQ
jgi:heptosyltransferase-1